MKVYLAGLAVIVAIAWYFAARPQLFDTTNNLDFSAFYCGASTLASAHDPYRFEPLHSCELRHLPFVDANNTVVPNPLPPYAIATFIPLTALNFVPASYVWWFIIAIAACVVAWSVAKLTALPPLLIAICTFPALLTVPLRTGSLAPVTIMLLCLAALAFVKGRDVLGVVLLICAFVEPHVALPAAVAVFLLRPAVRVKLAIAAAILVVISLSSGGISLNAEYFAQVLPAHAASELAARYQYSISSALYLFGVPEAGALLIGSLQYCVFVIAGIFVASRLRGVVSGAEVLAPVAFAVGGGTFVHIVQVAAALPFALLVAARLSSLWSWLAIVLLDTPWYSIFERFGGAYAQRLPTPLPSALAETSWKAFMGQFGGLDWLWWSEHLPVYLGLALLYLNAFRMLAVARRTADAATSGAVDGD